MAAESVGATPVSVCVAEFPCGSWVGGSCRLRRRLASSRSSASIVSRSRMLLSLRDRELFVDQRFGLSDASISAASSRRPLGVGRDSETQPSPAAVRGPSPSSASLQSLRSRGHYQSGNCLIAYRRPGPNFGVVPALGELVRCTDSA